jgi:DNA-binding response OmpR family regulator
MNEKRLLLVDDDEFILYTYKMILEKKGYIVDTVDNGKKTIDILGRSSYDLVILDIVLPDITGEEIAIHIRKSELDVEIILITAHSSYEKCIDCIGLGISDILLKPIPPIVENSRR